MTANMVSVSGGKDSTAMWLLAIERETPNMTVTFADTGNEHPLTYDYLEYLRGRLGDFVTVRADFSADIERKRRYVAEKWPEKGVPADQIARALEALKPTGVPFLDLVLMKGRFPSTRARFCTQELKRRPLDKVALELIAEHGSCVSWQGVRSDESKFRSTLPEREDAGGFGLSVYRPLIKSTIDDVWAILRRHGVRRNPLYDAGCTRVGCMPCIHANKSEIALIARQWPEEFDRVREWEALASQASKRGVGTFFSCDKTPGQHQIDHALPTPGIDEVVVWATRTGRGGRQFVMEMPIEESGCSAGLCE